MRSLARLLKGPPERDAHSHDGVFNTKQTFYSTEELYFPEQSFGAGTCHFRRTTADGCTGGTPWENPAGYERWSPSNHVGNWHTPQLVIHGSRVRSLFLAVNDIRRLSYV